MDYKIEKMALGIDDKVEYYYQQEDLQKMLIDKDTAMTLQWELMKEKFEKAIEGMIPPQPRGYKKNRQTCIILDVAGNRIFKKEQTT